MCHLCYSLVERPYVTSMCEACGGDGSGVNGARCKSCRGSGYRKHHVSFECMCDGCRTFRGEPLPKGHHVVLHALPPEIEVAMSFGPISDLSAA